MNDRLSQIETVWTMVHDANSGEVEGIRDSQIRFLGIYGPAARQYLLGAVKDTHVADDLFQDFALRFLRGDLRNADPSRGNFRSYLKSVLYRMVADHYRHNKKQLPSMEDLDPAVDESISVDTSTANRRQCLLDMGWQRLKKLEAVTGKMFYSVLRLRADQPNLRSAEMARVIAEQTGQEVSQANIRVLLHRARDRFERILVESIAETLGTSSIERIEDELASLDLLDRCRTAVQKYARS